MLKLLITLIQAIQPFLVPLCFVCAWGLMILLVWSVGSAIFDTLRRAQRMHQIPCADCAYFTKDYHLKCPVRPTIALSEEAIDCPDFCSVGGRNS
ncbi:hypothetical protein M595_1573 [Lyngbya aestuarii BL J]|uniref:Uncharacterized protein n=1 Tax=Lyngbya aestuarii BL J TaxID=1348334 RepID=U7QN03_9CYAN|nr:hypothetical protein [Lyngbya aestuarii]ERT08460.1 hypothetical protein M595_1573 [Lyngbya aestuarii BL J]